MPFDAILGVGRSPKVTEDLKFPQYSLVDTDIAPTASIEIQTEFGTVSGTLGDLNNIIEPEFDYVNNIPYEFTATQNAGSNSTRYIRLKFSKNIFIKKVIVLWSYEVTAGNPNITFAGYIDLLQSSPQNLWITTIAGASGTSEILSQEINFSRFNNFSIILGVTSSSPVGSASKLRLHKIKVFADNIQYS